MLCSLFLLFSEFPAAAQQVEWTSDLGNFRFNEIIETSDGHYLLAGYAVYPMGSVSPTWKVIKTDSNGNVIWTHERPNRGSAWDIIEDSRGDYIVTGSDGSGAWIKLDTAGNTVATAYPGNVFMRGTIELPSGNFLSALTSIGTISTSHFCQVTDSNDTGVQNTVINFLGFYDVRGMARTNGGRNVFAGLRTTQTTPTLAGHWFEVGDDGSILQIDSTVHFVVEDVEATPDGGVMIAGVDLSPATSRDVTVRKLDAQLQIQWEKQLVGVGFANEAHLAVTADGGCVVGVQDPNTSTTGKFIYRLNALGDSLWRYEIPAPGALGLKSVAVTQDGSILVGLEDSEDQFYKISDFITQMPGPNTPDAVTLRLFPQPAQDFCTFTIDASSPVRDGRIHLYDLHGRQLRSFDSGSRTRFQFSVDGLPAGAYVVRYENAAGLNLSQRLMVQR
ncbi:MAG: T9SS type A sorting domain-containing protein [Bacteroidota bacterium]